MKQTTRVIFLLKIILGTILASAAGGVLASYADYTDPVLRSWAHGFVFTFFPLACLVLVQWLLLSDYLPKWWVTLGIVGSIIAGATIGIIFLYITTENYISHALIIGTLNAFVSGTLATFPQWFLLKGKKGFLWVLSNGLGQAIQVVGLHAVLYPSFHDTIYLAFLRVLILELPVVPLGLALGLYLYTFVYKPKHSQFVEGGDSKL